MELRLARLHYPVTVLGPGRRFGIWFQGCTIGCGGCMSRDTWDPAGGSGTSVEDVVAFAERAVREAGLDGVTISGGEPFQQPDALGALLAGLRRQVPHVDVLVYSGYTLGVLRRRFGETLGLVDAVISGPFVAGEPTLAAWRGSDNQRLTVLSEVHRRSGRFGEPALRPGLQVGVDEESVYVIGIPRRGDLEDLEARLDGFGLQLEGVSWRP